MCFTKAGGEVGLYLSISLPWRQSCSSLAPLECHTQSLHIQSQVTCSRTHPLRDYSSNQSTYRVAYFSCKLQSVNSMLTMVMMTSIWSSDVNSTYRYQYHTGRTLCIFPWSLQGYHVCKLVLSGTSWCYESCSSQHVCWGGCKYTALYCC